MIKSYIKPESLSPAEVRQVLAFLNGAQTIEEIADTIEIPGELDVGLRVAQRLLNRRESLGGEFSDIQQVANTPYVGSERFTEIVAVLTGRSIERVSESGVVSLPVLQELRELREMVRSLQTTMGVKYRISMRLAQAGLYLGQSAIILVEVRDVQKNRPKANLPLTIATSWGLLETHVGFEKRHGSIVTAQTNINGKAKIKITGPTYEQLADAQQLALDSALRTLDPAAPTPNDVATELDNLVLQYQARGNVALRQAMDIYFRTRRDALSSAINPPSSNFAWPYFDALVTAYLHEDKEQSKYSNVVESTAVLKVRVKDWMDPWYQAYIKRLNESCTICEDFNRFKDQVTDKGLLLDNMVNRLYSFASGEFGLVGESVAEKVAQRQVNHFLSTGLEGLPFGTRQILFPALDLAAKNITTTQIGTLVVMGQVRTDINQNVDTKFGQLGDIGAFMEVVTSVQSQLGLFDTNYGQFNSDYGQFQSDFGQFNSSYNQFQGQLGQFQTDYGQFNVANSQLQNDINQFQTALGQFNTDYNQFQIDIGQFNVANSQLQNDINQFQTALGQFNTDYNQFQIDIGQFNVANMQLQNDLGQFQTDLNQFNVDYKQFGTDLGQSNKDLDEFNAANEAFQVAVGEFNTNYGTFQSNYSQFTNRYNKFNNSLSQVDTRLDTFETSIASFSTEYIDFSQKYDDFINKNKAFNNNLVTVNNNLAGFNTKYISFNTNYSMFNNNVAKFNTDLSAFNQDYTKIKDDLQVRNGPTGSVTRR